MMHWASLSRGSWTTRLPECKHLKATQPCVRPKGRLGGASSSQEELESHGRGEGRRDGGSGSAAVREQMPNVP